MSKMAIDANSKPIQVLRPSTVRVTSISGSAANGSSFTDNVRVARIVATVDSFYRVGATATTSHNFLPANTIEYIHVLDDEIVSFITAGGTGTAYVSAMI